MSELVESKKVVIMRPTNPPGRLLPTLALAVVALAGAAIGTGLRAQSLHDDYKIEILPSSVLGGKNSKL